MKQYKRGAVAPTAEGGSRKRAEGATGDSLYNTYSGRPVLSPTAYKGYRQLVVKNNDGIADDVDILRVANYLCELGGFRMTQQYFFENGKQGRRHLHALIRAPKIYNLIEMTETFKNKERLSFEIMREVQLSPVFSKPFLEIHYIQLQPYTFEVELFTSNEHIFYCVEEYWMKEQVYIHQGCIDTDFVDDKEQYNFKRAYISALSSL